MTCSLTVENFIFEYLEPYLFLIIKENKECVICLSKKLFYKNGIRRNIHSKYYYKTFIFSQHINNLTDRMIDYMDDGTDYIYNCNRYLNVIDTPKIRDDTCILQKKIYY